MTVRDLIGLVTDYFSDNHLCTGDISNKFGLCDGCIVFNSGHKGSIEVEIFGKKVMFSDDEVLCKEDISKYFLGTNESKYDQAIKEIQGILMDEEYNKLVNGKRGKIIWHNYSYDSYSDKFTGRVVLFYNFRLIHYLLGLSTDINCIGVMEGIKVINGIDGELYDIGNVFQKKLSREINDIFFKVRKDVGGGYYIEYDYFSDKGFSLHEIEPSISILFGEGNRLHISGAKELSLILELVNE